VSEGVDSPSGSSGKAGRYRADHSPEFAGYLEPQDHAHPERREDQVPAMRSPGQAGGVENAPGAGAGPADLGCVRTVSDIGALDAGVVMATSDVDGGDPADGVLFSGGGDRAG
jgi:hypothetical protein